MNKTIYSFKGKLLTGLPPFWAKMLYSINHKPLLFRETKYAGIDFSVYIPHTMEANYNHGHEIGVAQRFMERYQNRENFVFWDVGSCFAYFSGMVAALNPGTQLFAFEPFVGHYMYIQKSTQAGLLPQLGLIRKFVGATQTADMITLDAFAAETHIPAPNLIKIDVDGAEMGVLDGCRETIARHRPDFLIELDCNRYKLTHASLRPIIEKYFAGYQCSVLLDVHKNNTEWDQQKWDEVDISATVGDIYLHLYQ